MESEKKSINVEELTKQYEEAKKNFENLGVELRLAQKEEEERRKAQLALEKETRKKEVDDALENCRTLVNAYIKDYGSYRTITTSHNFPFNTWWF